MYNNELYHHGVKGMKWGVRRKSPYKSTGVRSAMARRQNEKVDKSFKTWKENSDKKADAISKGKTANQARIAYERDKGNKSLKKDYRQANKEYKKALSKNTTWRKGDIKKEVGQDLSRKHLSEAKKVKKELDKNPGNKELQKKYNKLMSQHDVERAKARRAPQVAQNRSRKKAAIKRTMTMTVKTAAATAAVSAGAYAANRYLSNHNVTLNGKDVRINREHIQKFNNAVKLGKKFMKFI